MESWRTVNFIYKRAKNLRQTLLFSSYPTPELNSIFKKQIVNVKGKVLICRDYSNKGSISDVTVQLPQIFHRLPCSKIVDSDDDRFKFFIEKV